MSGQLISLVRSLWLGYCYYYQAVMLDRDNAPCLRNYRPGSPVDTQRRFNLNTTSYRRWNDVVCLLPPSYWMYENWPFILPLVKLVLEILIVFATTLCSHTKFVVLIQHSFLPSSFPPTLRYMVWPYDLPTLKFVIEILCFCYHATQQHRKYRSFVYWEVASY